MLNVIRFLEQLGGEAQWDELTKDKLEAALADANVENTLRGAILSKDIGQLQVLLRQKPLIGMVIPGEEEEEGEEPEEEGEEEAHRKLTPTVAARQ